MTDYPTMTTATISRSIDPILEVFRKSMRRAADALLNDFEDYATPAIHRAYAEGLRDGFVQGAIAQHPSWVVEPPDDRGADAPSPTTAEGSPGDG